MTNPLETNTIPSMSDTFSGVTNDGSNIESSSTLDLQNQTDLVDAQASTTSPDTLLNIEKLSIDPQKSDSSVIIHEDDEGQKSTNGDSHNISTEQQSTAEHTQQDVNTQTEVNTQANAKTEVTITLPKTPKAQQISSPRSKDFKRSASKIPNEFCGKMGQAKAKRNSMGELLRKFDDLIIQDNDDQASHFMKSFIFALGDNWKDVLKLQKHFVDYLRDANETHDLNPIQASDFLQKQNKTRTALERKSELKDIDLNNDNRITLTEFLLLVYKPLILKAYYKRMEEEKIPEEPRFDLDSTDSSGLTGIGYELLDELFTMPCGISAALEKAIEDFFKDKKAREKKMRDLEERSKLSGVKGLTAKAELAQMKAADLTAQNRSELTLMAAKRRAMRTSSAQVLKEKMDVEAKKEKHRRQLSRANLMKKASIFGAVSSPKTKK